MAVVPDDKLSLAIETVPCFISGTSSSNNFLTSPGAERLTITCAPRKPLFTRLTNTLEDAQKIKKSYKLGDKAYEKFVPKDFSRIAAQTAKQVILQKIHVVIFILQLDFVFCV